MESLAENSWQGSGTILLVDDDEATRALGSLILRQLGFEVLLAANGREAMKAFHGRQDEVRCVVLDLVMPVMDGAATLEALRQLAPRLPVIICSAYDVEEVARISGIDTWTSFVEKPFEIEGLKAAVMAALGKPA